MFKPIIDLGVRRGVIGIRILPRIVERFLIICIYEGIERIALIALKGVRLSSVLRVPSMTIIILISTSRIHCESGCNYIELIGRLLPALVRDLELAPKGQDGKRACFVRHNDMRYDRWMMELDWLVGQCHGYCRM